MKSEIIYILGRLSRLIGNQRGATAIEYGLIATFIAIAAIGAIRSVGPKVANSFNNVSTTLGAKVS